MLNTDHLVSILVNILSRWGRQQYNQHISISPHTHLSDKLHLNCPLLTIATSWDRSGGQKRSEHWVDFMKLFLHYQNILLSHTITMSGSGYTNVCQIPLKCYSKVVLTWLYFAVRPIQTSKIIFVGYLIVLDILQDQDHQTSSSYLGQTNLKFNWKYCGYQFCSLWNCYKIVFTTKPKLTN